MKNISKAAVLLAAVLMIFCITGCGDNAGGTPTQTQTPTPTPAEPLFVARETPLTLEAIAAGTITLTNPWSTLKYKKNGGDFVSVTASANTIAVAAGDKVAFYADGSENTYPTYLKIECSADCYVYGNVMSLLSSINFKTDVTIPDTMNYAFEELFSGNTHIKNHAQKALVLPATTLTYFCYENMFNGCTGLTIAPTLPATELVAGCYSNMFNGCSSLNSVTCLATYISTASCTSSWLDGVAATGTFKKAASMDDWTTNSVSGIPTGWTVQDYTAQ
ncbi:MAG: hypothetical protein J5747_10205 [Spirochaetaceae bacterium]|nr:hypothetical protein [Spirochaetaceae bacterium]